MKDRLWHVQNARRELDAQVVAARAEIAQIHLRICDLNSRRNELANISRLPTETLCEIFAQCMAPGEQESQQEYCETRKPASLPNILHVCRYWRAVALSNTALWASITDAVPLRWIEYMLTLAQSTPLSVSLRRHLCPEDRETVIAKLLSQPWRMRSLEVCRHPDVVTKFLAPMAGGFDSSLSSSSPAAPLLESLKLRGVIPASSTKMVQIPEGLLADGTPNLRVLELTNCHIRWATSTLFDHLHTFKFSTTNPDGIQYSSPTDLLDALARMPELVHLELCARQLSGMAEVNLNPQDRVSLPCLQHLRCNVKKLEDGCGLIRNLAIPSSATVALECAAADAKAESFTPSLEDLSLLHGPSTTRSKAAVEPSGIPLFRTARLRTQGYSTLMESALQFVDLSLSKGPGDPFPGNTFSVRFEPRLAEPLGGLSILAQPSTSTVQALELHIDVPSYDEFERAMLELPLLENISVTAGTAAWLVELINSRRSPEDRCSDGNEEASVSMPRLNTVTFVHVEFSERRCCPGIVRRPVHMKTLITALQRRLGSGKPLDKLAFRQCSNIGKEEHGDAMEAVVTSGVVWCRRRATNVKTTCMFAGSCSWCIDRRQASALPEMQDGQGMRSIC